MQYCGTGRAQQECLATKVVIVICKNRYVYTYIYIYLCVLCVYKDIFITLVKVTSIMCNLCSHLH